VLKVNTLIPFFFVGMKEQLTVWCSKEYGKFMSVFVPLINGEVKPCYKPHGLKGVLHAISSHKGPQGK
jgi:hypothetical protein